MQTNSDDRTHGSEHAHGSHISIRGGETGHGGERARLSKEVTDAGCANAHKHLDKLGGVQGQESDAGLSGYSARQQRLAGPGGPAEEDAAGDARARPPELLRLQEEVHHLHKLHLHGGHLSAVSEADSFKPP